jgi:drug/metabolite transporter (DMT)-like permease
MSSTEDETSANLPRSDRLGREARIGVALGIVSALGYTGANLALKEVANSGDPNWAVWVTANKAVPAALVAWFLIALRAKQGLPALPPRRLVGKLLLASVLMQYGGNFMFQWSLCLGGLAIAVPLCFAGIIVTGAWMGKVLLNDPITPKTMVSIGILGVSILFLSVGAHEATQSLDKHASVWTTVMAVMSATIAGCSYGATGVMIRRMVTGENSMSLSASLVTFSTFGVVVLGIHSWLALGWDRIAATTSEEWLAFLIAGTTNAIAFFAVAGALKRITVNFVNVLNASQNAMCAAAGVWLFSEPSTVPLIIGCSLTIFGLLLIDGGKREPG